jgi:solute:Na+ symporter, SSS family
MAQSFWGAIFAWTGCFLLTVLISLVTKARDEKDLVGLVYSLTPKQTTVGLSWHRRPLVLGVIVLAVSIALNLYFFLVALRRASLAQGRP